MHCLSSLLRPVAETGVGRKVVFHLISNSEGVTAIEYGLIAALIAVAAVVVMGTVGQGLSTVFSEVATSL